MAFCLFALFERRHVFRLTYGCRLWVLREGEMSSEQIKKEIVKVSLQTPTLELETPYWNDLPEIFRQFVAHSLRLEARIQYLRAGWETPASCELSDENPVGKQIELLKTAFGGS